MPRREREAFFINNVTDSNYYFVETGEVASWLCLIRPANSVRR